MFKSALLVCLLGLTLGASADPLAEVKAIVGQDPVADLRALRAKANAIDWRGLGAPRALFDLVLEEYLLRFVPRDAADRVRRMVRLRDEGSFVSYGSSEGRGRRGTPYAYMQVNMVDLKIEGDFPLEFRNSVLDYAYLIHEMDHVLIAVLMKRRTPAEVFTVLHGRPFNRSFYNFRLEVRAIFAEWLYLHLLDSALRDRVYDDLEGRVFPEDFQEMNLRSLRNSVRSFAQYLGLEHRAGRYAPQMFAPSFSADEVRLGRYVARSSGVGICGGQLGRKR